MPLEETLDTYTYYFSELDKLGLAYIVIVRYTPYMDAEYDGLSPFLNHRAGIVLKCILPRCQTSHPT